MTRPRKNRFVWGNPVSNFFKPAGIRLSEIDHLALTFDEFEAVRLADREGLYQEEAAKIMNISRQTFGRVLQEAHRKIAECLVQGKALKIEGGNYVTAENIFNCRGCGNMWGRQPDRIPDKCPECENSNIQVANQGGPFGRGPMRGRGRRRGGGPPWQK